MEIGNILLIISAIGNLGMGLFVYFHNRKSWTNFAFSILAYVLVFWIVSMIIFRNFAVNELLIWTKILYSSAIMAVITLLIFTFNFPEGSKRPIWLTIITTLIASALLYLTLNTSLIITGVKHNAAGENIITFGAFYPLFFWYVISYVSIAMVDMVLKFKNAIGIERQQIKYFFAGLLITATTSLIFNLTMPSFGIFDYQWYGQISTFIMLGFMTYAIVKLHLLNIRAIAAELLTFIIWLFLLTQTLLAPSLKDRIINGGFLFIMIVFGILLIRSVLKEVKQRERLEILTKELEDKNLKLIELDKIRSEFLSFASHQVKAPMTVVKGFASLIYEGSYGAVNEKVKETARKIEEVANQLIGLVNNLLDLRRVEEGKMDYKFEETDIVALISGLIENFQLIAKQKGLALNFESAKPSIKIKADGEKLRQVIQNLIDNAIKYTKDGYVKSSVKEEDETILITIEDTGRGMSPEFQKRLFDRFNRDETVKKEIAGTGLGLYIAKEIIKAHGGEIWAESEGLEMGSNFFVRLRKS